MTDVLSSIEANDRLKEDGHKCKCYAQRQIKITAQKRIDELREQFLLKKEGYNLFELAVIEEVFDFLKTKC